MSEISIDTLKTMLANLDDAKKYQSLRDVMETLPAPDLAAVFEDLPAEKLPVLFRLCPKDLAADVFTELTPETQQKLIDGLTDTELKAVVDELCVDDATDLVEEIFYQKLNKEEQQIIEEAYHLRLLALERRREYMGMPVEAHA